MVPPLIVEQARAQGLTMLGIADHNSAANTAAVIEAAGDDLIIKPGLEVETKETVHLLCLFDTPEQALSLQALIYAHLPAAFNERKDLFGPRLLVADDGHTISQESRPLFLATDLALDEALAAAHERGALVLASHVERRAHGLLGVLGFIPPEADLDGLEAGPGGLTAGRVAGSDAHHLWEIGSRYTIFEAASPSVADLKYAVANGSFRTGVVV
jgi:3',5'-nucleoside bisphosphate phosphatase